MHPLSRLLSAIVLGPLLASACPSSAAAQLAERLDYAMLGRIRDEGLQRSQVMDIISWLSDVNGPRLTGSPGFRNCAQQQFADCI